MANGEVTVNLPQLEKAILLLGNAVIEQGMAGASQAVVGKIKQSWAKGQSGEGATLQSPPISKSYKAYKESSGRNGVIDFNFTSDLYKSFGTKKLDGTKATISFEADQLPKARSLMNRRPQGMEVGPKLTKIAVDQFNKWLRKVVGFK